MEENKQINQQNNSAEKKDFIPYKKRHNLNKNKLKDTSIDEDDVNEKTYIQKPEILAKKEPDVLGPKQKKDTPNARQNKKPQNKLFIKEIPSADKDDQNKLIIGKKSEMNIYIPTKSRLSNLMVFGIKSSGKTDTVLTMLANQDMANKNIGATFFVNDESTAFQLFALAKAYKRKVEIIKPSTEIEVLNSFLWKEDFNYEYMNNEIVDFEAAISKKKIIIIDMEYLRYKNYAVIATKKLIKQFQIAMININSLKRGKSPIHYLYVDNSATYIKELADILTYSKSMNVGVTLLAQSREEFADVNDKNYKLLIDSNIRNYILMNAITIDDAKYFVDKFTNRYDISHLMNRPEGQIIYEIVDSLNVRAVGLCTVAQINDSFRKELEVKAKRFKTSKLKYLKKAEHVGKAPKKEYKSHEPKNFDIFSTVLNATEPYERPNLSLDDNSLVAEQDSTAEEVFVSPLETENDEDSDDSEKIVKDLELKYEEIATVSEVPLNTSEIYEDETDFKKYIDKELLYDEFDF